MSDDPPLAPEFDAVPGTVAGERAKHDAEIHITTGFVVPHQTFDPVSPAGYVAR